MKFVGLAGPIRGKNGSLKKRYKFCSWQKIFLNRWICDGSLVTLLKDNYEINFQTKSYLNKYIQTIYLKDCTRYNYSFHCLENDKNMIICKTFLYYFTRSNNMLKYYTTKEELQEIYHNFLFLRCSATHQLTNAKRNINQQW